MQTYLPPQPNPPAGSSAPRRIYPRIFNLFALPAAGLLLSGLAMSSLILLGTQPALAAQTPAGTQAATPAHKPVHHRRRLAAAHPTAPQAVAAPAPVVPAPPPPPNWPANNPPTPATVTWDSHGLHVVASNSSLEQILNEICTDTGAQVEGLGKDERIFGVYGPGQVRDVISELLDGTGYNVVMIGDQSRGEPLQITLSARNVVSPANAKSAAPAAPPDYDAIMDSPDHMPDQDQEPPDQPQEQLPPPEQPPPDANPPASQAGTPPNTPQQIEQQYQQRQLQMQQTVNQPN
jgi:hypothetical protein